ncbi:MAG: glycoside hydrolase family 31 protein, partial [Bacteroidaceae bacterium]|nr:glycoside hydrolase family 31 protein [Bacteroidaceae bacterium]
DDLKEWRELQARWNQFGCFIPIYRAHGQWPLREVWNIAPEGHPAYESIVWYHRLRYRMMSYLYSMAGWVHLHDYTMMRALVMDFNGDKNVQDIKDQWMFGPSLMACPVSTYQARSREVYFPKECGWYDLYTGKKVIDRANGSQPSNRTLVIDAPYERIPVFVPEGAILPIGPDMEWSDEKPAELIDLYIYAGRDGQFELYEDEGTNYNYEQGAFSTINIQYDNARKVVTIGERKGKFEGMLKQRRFNIVLVTPNNAQPLASGKANGTLVNYTGKAMSVNLGHAN